jgi:hypothetical protein
MINKLSGDERLTALHIACLIDENKSWNEWTKESELAREKLHDYFRGAEGAITYTVSYSDEKEHQDLPYWVQVQCPTMGSDELMSAVAELIIRYSRPTSHLQIRPGPVGF